MTRGSTKGRYRKRQKAQYMKAFDIHTPEGLIQNP
jgi:hypothetical protein